MTYSDPHTYVTFGGTAFGGKETWQFGLRFGRQWGGRADLQALQDAATTYIAASGTGISAAAKLEWVKVADINEDGHYDGDEWPRVKDFTPVPGAVGAGDHVVPQASMCISLDTDQNRGLAHAGRYYLPCTGIMAHTTDGGVTVADQAALLATTKTFLDKLQDIADDIGPNPLHDTWLAVHSKVGTGAMHRVTHVRVGRVVDTIRSRRASLDEAYLTAEVKRNL